MLVAIRVDISKPIFFTASTTLFNFSVYNLNLFTSTPKNTFTTNRHHKCISFHNLYNLMFYFVKTATEVTVFCTYLLQYFCILTCFSI